MRTIAARFAAAAATTLLIGLAGAPVAQARPTDTDDDRGDQYSTTNVKSTCSTHICVHWVPTTIDKPAAGWVDTVSKEMEKIWSFEVGKMGYRAPLKDGQRGGNAKFDVYLKDVGPKGYAGYCDAEKTVSGYLATSYCVFDNDFAPAQFGGRNALNNFRVTAAHQFFLAVQMAYDNDEDAWLKESTAAWMEERYADSVNYNRSYLPAGQLGAPSVPLDLGGNSVTSHFGNWIWWEYLTQRLGNGVVKQVWTKAGEFSGGGHLYSIEATKAVLKANGGFGKRFGSYLAGNIAPGTTYDEGGSWGLVAPLSATHTLTAGGSSGAQSVTIDHLAGSNVRFVPASGVTGKLRINVDGPDAAASPSAIVSVWKKNGTISRSSITLNSSGVGQATVTFDAATIHHVTVTFVNASTRYTCWVASGDPAYACSGTPKDDDKVFGYTATNVTG